ncbi:HhH-GDP family DNA glycosylase [Mycolicibacterium baixiangningiae]|uniref:endonuclease n=1 Tax=Mycolicibacterium baixiangningiae TaxID=2761578 RepID=UPI0018685559|nr:endonuclease [Mycolicibacterium baixiangningiae]
MGASQQIVQRLRDQAGQTYAEEAGIALADKPMPLFQLLVLCMLASKPIDATVAMRAARELFSAGVRTPDAVLDTDRTTMIAAFGRAGYARYDESSATRLVELARAVREDYGGDLRRLGENHDPETARRKLQEFKGIGDTGSSIFLREVQDTWTWLRPYFDERALDAAARLGLPADPATLQQLAPDGTAALAAALVRAALDDDLLDRVRG